MSSRSVVASISKDSDPPKAERNDEMKLTLTNDMRKPGVRRHPTVQAP
jgi:hypothetical protein